MGVQSGYGGGTVGVQRGITGLLWNYGGGILGAQ